MFELERGPRGWVHQVLFGVGSFAAPFSIFCFPPLIPRYAEVVIFFFSLIWPCEETFLPGPL